MSGIHTTQKTISIQTLRELVKKYLKEQGHVFNNQCCLPRLEEGNMVCDVEDAHCPAKNRVKITRKEADAIISKVKSIDLTTTEIEIV